MIKPKPKAERISERRRVEILITIRSISLARSHIERLRCNHQLGFAHRAETRNPAERSSGFFLSSSLSSSLP